MPAWTSRILPSTSSSSSHSNPVHAPPPPSNRINAIETDRNALIAIDYNVPILSPTTPTATTTTSTAAASPSRNRRRSHARSISQPFPSLMNASALRKADKKPSTNRDFPSTVDLDDDEPNGVGANKIRSPSEDMVSGRCMACNSTCRWPRHVHVFRCMICLTVNDLEPRPPAANTGVQHDDADDEAHPPAPPPKDGSPVPSLPGMWTICLLNMGGKLQLGYFLVITF